jgi:hypothetical protein
MTEQTQRFHNRSNFGSGEVGLSNLEDFFLPGCLSILFESGAPTGRFFEEYHEEI